MAMVLGYFVGYIFIAEVLLPMFYKLQLYIYLYLPWCEIWRKNPTKPVPGFFLLSRTIGSAFRLYLTTKVLQLIVFNALGVPYWLTVTGFVAFIWIYIHAKGGIKTVIWTDTFQAIIMLFNSNCNFYCYM